MKNYISQEEGVWFSLVNYTPTEEQALVLKTIPATEEDAILKAETLDAVKSASREALTTEEAVELVALYNAHKPMLKEGDAYVFIDMNVSGSNGLLNCRVNGEQKQIRF